MRHIQKIFEKSSAKLTPVNHCKRHYVKFTRGSDKELISKISSVEVTCHVIVWPCVLLIVVCIF